MITTQYKSDVIQYKQDGVIYYGLQVDDYLIPFPYFMKTDVVVALLANDKDRVLELNKDYTLEGSTLNLNTHQLGLTKGSLTASLSITRNTEVNLAEFTPGHPVKAGDLNDNFNAILYRIEENTYLATSNTVVSDNQPVNPYKGQRWLRTPYYREFVYDGIQWVEPQ